MDDARRFQVVLKWSILVSASALPASFPWFLDGDFSAALGVVLGMVFWITITSLMELKHRRHGRMTSARAMTRGAVIQATATVTFGFLASNDAYVFYVPAATLVMFGAQMLASFLLGMATSTSVSMFALTVALTIVCGAQHFIASLVLGAMFSPNEPTRRGHGKSPVLSRRVDDAAKSSA